MKTYGVMKVNSIILDLDIGRDFMPRIFYSREKAPDTHWRGG
jgi:hypothetical protein